MAIISECTGIAVLRSVRAIDTDDVMFEPERRCVAIAVADVLGFSASQMRGDEKLLHDLSIGKNSNDET